MVINFGLAVRSPFGLWASGHLQAGMASSPSYSPFSTSRYPFPLLGVSGDSEQKAKRAHSPLLPRSLPRSPSGAPLGHCSTSTRLSNIRTSWKFSSTYCQGSQPCFYLRVHASFLRRKTNGGNLCRITYHPPRSKRMEHNLCCVGREGGRGRDCDDV